MNISLLLGWIRCAVGVALIMGVAAIVLSFGLNLLSN